MSVRNRFAWSFLGQYMVCMVIQGVIWFCVTLFIQYRGWNWLPQSVRFCGNNDITVDEVDHEVEDDDVVRERNRIMSHSSPQNVLEVRRLLKRYNKKSKPAVNGLTFGVKRGECFGLLGVNGAGKTTTFKMLTGETDKLP